MSGNKEQIDVSLIGNDKIEEAIVNIQKEPTEENLVRALSIVRHRMNDKGQLIIAVEPPLPDGKLNLKVIKTEDGQMWWIAYTSFDEELKGGMFHEREAYSRCVETSIYVDNNMKHMGIGGILHKTLEDELRKDGFLNMYACIACPKKEDEYLNRNSIEFHSHQGYRLVGEFYDCGYKFKRWYNMVWMEKLIGEHTDK